MIDFIQNFGILVLLIAGVSFAVKFLRQPIIIGYVISGMLFAVFGGSYRPMSEQITLMAELGITFLLFLMGLEFDLKSLRYLGKDVLFTTLLQSVLFGAIGWALATLFGFASMERVYLAILFMFSSTLLAAKWIDDKRESSTLHGKIALGTLIVQDILAIVAITILSMLGEQSLTRIALAPLQGLLLIAIAFALSRYILNDLLRVASRYPELLFVASVSVCFLFALIAPRLGYSTAIGAFIGGITLANTAYKTEIVGRLKPLILFFNMLFFVGLGFQIDPHIGWKTAAFLTVFVSLAVVLKPIIVHATLRLRGYDSKTAFLSGTYLSQLSEFGIIIVAAGVAGGTIGAGLSSLTALAVILSMVLSSYLIKYDRQLHALVEPLLPRFGHQQFAQTKGAASLNCNIVFFGYYALSQELYTKLQLLGKRILVIENDPEQIELLRQDKIPYLYNSANNPELFAHLSFARVELVISNLMDSDANQLILHHVKRANPKCTIIVTAKDIQDSLALYDAQADYVISPTALNEQHVAVLLEDYTSDINSIISKKVIEVMKLKDRQQHIAATHRTKLFQDIDTFIHRMKQRQRKPKVRDFKLDEFIKEA